MPGFAPPQHRTQEDGHKVQHVQAGIWWPKADPARLRAAAQAWRQMGTALQNIQANCQSAVLGIQAENDGRAIAAFGDYWQKWSKSDGYLPECAGACKTMADALDKYAAAVEDAQNRVKALIIEAGTAVIVGVALGICTLGIAAVAADAVATGLIASAALIGIDLSVTAAGIAGGIIVGIGFGAVEAMAIDAAVIQPERLLVFHDQQSFSWSEVFTSGEWGAVGGAFAGTATTGIRAVGTALPRSTSRVISSRLGETVTGTLVGGGTSAAIDELQTGDINPLDVASGAVGGAAAGGVRAPTRLGPNSYRDPVVNGRLPEYTRPPARGIFHLPGDDVLSNYPLRSQYEGPTKEIPKETFPGFNHHVRSHVEAHAAAIMRLGDMGPGDEAALEINRIPCPGPNGCAVNLPRMLPPGATLHIYGPDGYYKAWVGTPDP
jgi:uncharacterized protein YukE